MESVIADGRRVRNHTAILTNLRIDERTYENVKYYAGKSEAEITRRIKELNSEWDIERVLETNMSALALTGIVLSQVVNRKWLALPTVVLGFFAQHAIQGWCPPVSVFRALKVRTRDEIDQEKHALKALRGDYEGVQTAEQAFTAAKKLNP